MTGDHYLIDSPEVWNKFTAMHALTLESLRNAHLGGHGVKQKPYVDFIIMMV